MRKAGHHFFPQPGQTSVISCLHFGQKSPVLSL